MKSVNKILCLLIVAFFAGMVFIQPSTAQTTTKGVVRVIGADSMAHSVTILANEFSGNNPDCNILVSGGPSLSGWDKLVTGTADIAMMSAEPTKDQQAEAKAKGIEPHGATIGWGGIVLITHPSNPVDSLSLDQVRRLLSGQITNWKDVGGSDKTVSIISVTEGAREGTVRFVTEGLIKGSVAPGARLLAYFRSVPPTVAETPASLGIIRMRNLERMIEQGQDKRIKVLGVKKDDRSPAVTPSRESIDEGTYPINRPYFLYLSSKASKCAMDFFKFCEARNPRPQSAASPRTARK